MKKGNIEQRGINKFRLTFNYHYKRYRKTIIAKNKNEAKVYLKKWIEQIESNIYRKKYSTVRDFCKKWIEKQVLPNSTWDRTAKKYQSFFDTWFLPYFGNKFISEITKEDLTEYFNWLRTQKTQYQNRKQNKTLSYGTLLKYKSILHAMFQTAVEWKKIEENPCNIKLINTSNYDTRVDYYRYSEYLSVLDLINNQKVNILKSEININELRDFSRLVLIELALKTGLRRSEIFGLTKFEKDINLEEQMLDINKTRQYTKNNGKQTLTTKNKTSVRRISLPNSIIPTLQTLLNLIPEHQIYIFEHLSIDGICSWFKKWQQENNIRVIRFHDIRHTHASILLYKGLDIKTISERLGHSQVQTTLNTYIHIIKELNQKASIIIDEL